MSILPIDSLALYSFIVIIMLMIITPGANQILVLQSAVIISPKAAIFNVLGIASSMFIHALLSGLGVSLIIMQSPGLYSFIKILGAGYIVYLAISSIISAYHLYQQSNVNNEAAASLNQSYEGIIKSFSKGFTTNILNIHTSFIFLSIFPQYMNQDNNLFIQSLFLTLIFILLLLIWYTFLISFICKVRNHLLKPTTQMSIKAVTGTLLLIMGIKIGLN